MVVNISPVIRLLRILTRIILLFSYLYSVLLPVMWFLPWNSIRGDILSS